MLCNCALLLLQAYGHCQAAYRLLCYILVLQTADHGLPGLPPTLLPILLSLLQRQDAWLHTAACSFFAKLLQHQHFGKLRCFLQHHPTQSRHIQSRRSKLKVDKTRSMIAALAALLPHQAHLTFAHQRPRPSINSGKISTLSRFRTSARLLTGSSALHHQMFCHQYMYSPEGGKHILLGTAQNWVWTEQGPHAEHLSCVLQASSQGPYPGCCGSRGA